ncbi:tumor necrosis factor receptor superfamily member 6B-like isoform X2 [Anoplopoma fimbria]|uniref:tumor necrosis factor receptor superfamily member 6B-like isoform X2 n=1 Tax=Anoplopoma fimbria TaxID=229290 RepID=UPI0023ECA104|nr:tumor necrosis factor receptor superfamily member 6B-like isoform X2 [Anoplopoma fimbria]
MILLLLLLLSMLAAPLHGAAAPRPTFRDTDPTTGVSVRCDSCPPGSYLRSSCTATRKSECEPCPTGSFTELWNYIGKCLRCGVCDHNQVVRTQCTADSDCQCECRQGYYFKKDYGMCYSHSACPAGQEVLAKGTAEEDTVCHDCPNGTFSDTVSAHKNCTLHKSCDAPGTELVLKGSIWHDSVCTTCNELTSRDGGDYLKEILPSFFLHQKINIKRLRRILHKLPTENASQIRQLPSILTKLGADSAGERLQNKLHRIDSNLKELCNLRNEVDVVVFSG